MTMSEPSAAECRSWADTGRAQNAIEAVFDEYETRVEADLLFALALAVLDETAAELRRIADEEFFPGSPAKLVVRDRADELDGGER